MADRERPIAEFAPSIRSIKLYADGRIDYQGKSGSVIGAIARIEKSGEKRRVRDTRKVVLRIDGPSVAIAASLPAAGFDVHRKAEEFVEQINKVSNGVDGANPAPGLQSAPDPPKTIDRSMLFDTSAPGAASVNGLTLESMDALIGQLERLGKLRDQGVLTEEEFQAQKNALLRVAHDS
jgi:Short C-terminal domain